MNVFAEAVVHLQGDFAVVQRGGALLAVLHYAGEQHLFVPFVAQNVEYHTRIGFVGFQTHIQPRQHLALREVGHHDVRKPAQLEHFVAVSGVKNLVKFPVFRHRGVDCNQSAARFEVRGDFDCRVRGVHRTEKSRVKAIEFYAELFPMRVRGQHIGVKVGVCEAFDAVSLRGEQSRGQPHRVVSAGTENGESGGQRTSADGRIVLYGQNSFIHTSSLAPAEDIFKTESKKVNRSKCGICRKSAVRFRKAGEKET